MWITRPKFELGSPSTDARRLTPAGAVGRLHFADAQPRGRTTLRPDDNPRAASEDDGGRRSRRGAECSRRPGRRCGCHQSCWSAIGARSRRAAHERARQAFCRERCRRRRRRTSRLREDLSCSGVGRSRRSPDCVARSGGVGQRPPATGGASHRTALLRLRLRCWSCSSLADLVGSIRDDDRSRHRQRWFAGAPSHSCSSSTSCTGSSPKLPFPWWRRSPTMCRLAPPSC